MFYVGSEDDLDGECFGLSGLDEAADEFELPGALDPLADPLEGADVLQEGVRLRVVECELDQRLLAAGERPLQVVALEVPRVFLLKLSSRAHLPRA